ncbi:MAG: GNAT family N-acetyltransferase [Alphaproteobacteria bacterium]
MAIAQDEQALRAMQAQCVHALAEAYYACEIIETYFSHIGTLDPALIADGTYFVVEDEGRLVGSGGWSVRRPHYEQAAEPTAPLLRGFFVHPDYARRGVGSALVERVERAVFRAGHDEARLTAMLSGVAFYRAHDYTVLRHRTVDLGDSVVMPVVDMAKRLGEHRMTA